MDSDREEKSKIQLKEEDITNLIARGGKISDLKGDKKKSPEKTLAETLGIAPQGKKDEKTKKPYGRII